jgi:hypothetical protein
VSVEDTPGMRSCKYAAIVSICLSVGWTVVLVLRNCYVVAGGHLHESVLAAS